MESCFSQSINFWYEFDSSPSLSRQVALSLLVVACRTGKGKSGWMMSLIDDFSEVRATGSRFFLYKITF